MADELDEVLGELQQALAGEQLELRHVQQQWRAKEVRVVVLGEAKRGKSSLINALAGRDLLPTGIIPVTSVATVVRKDPRQCLRVDFRDGRQVFAPLGRIADYVSEEGNPGNRLGVEAVEALVPDLPWPESVLFVDTPGTGSVAAYHDQASSAAAGTMDVALVVLTADPPISAREEHQISVATARSVELLVALTKSDLVGAEDLESVLRYTRRIVTSAAGRDVEIVSVSSRGSDEDPHPGLARIHNAISSLAEDPDQHTLARSIRSRARRLVRSELDELEVSLALADLDVAEAAERMSAFVRVIEEARRQDRTSSELIVAIMRSINDRADRSQESELLDLTEVLLDDVDRNSGVWVDTAGNEREAVEAITRRATDSAEAWRARTAAQLESELDEVGRRVTAAVEAVLSQVRGSARDLLGVDLTLPIEPVTMQWDPRFFYVQMRLPDSATAVAATVRRRLPLSLRRRAVGGYLREAARVLADQQLGRARGDLRRRLGEAERSLTREVSSSTRLLLERLQHAAERAAMPEEEQARVERLGGLTTRHQALEGLLDRIDVAGRR